RGKAPPRGQGLCRPGRRHRPLPVRGLTLGAGTPPAFGTHATRCYASPHTRPVEEDVEMRKLVIGVCGLALAFGTLGVAQGKVVCSKKNGVLVVRESACKAKEQAVNLADFGAVGPTGPVGGTGPAGSLFAALPSGQTLTGAF